MSTEAAAGRSSASQNLKLALLAFGMLIIAVDFNIVYVALPQIGHELNFSVQTLQWVVSAYAVTWGGFLLLGGRAVDRLGPRRMFVTALVIYAVSSLIGGFARDIGWLVGARAVQGMGAALLFPAVLALINLNFAEGPERNRAMAVWGGASASGLIVGSTVGGLLTHFLGWPWVFFINVPLALLAAAVGLKILARDPDSAGSGSFDAPGALLATAGATLIVFGLVSGPEAGWLSIRGAGALIVGVVLFALFLLIERRDADVLMPPRMFRHRSLVVAILMVLAFMTGINFLHYSYFIQLQDVLKFDPFQAGMAFVPITLGGLLGSVKALPALLKRWGLRGTLLVGILGLGVSMAGIAPTLTMDSSFWFMLPSTLLWGFSAGIAFSAIFLAAGTGVPPTEAGVASGMASTAQQIGGAMGLAVLVAIANAGLETTSNPPIGEVMDGLRTGMWVGAVLVSAGSLLAFLLSSEPTGGGDEASGSAASATEVPAKSA